MGTRSSVHLLCWGLAWNDAVVAPTLATALGWLCPTNRTLLAAASSITGNCRLLLATRQAPSPPRSERVLSQRTELPIQASSLLSTKFAGHIRSFRHSSLLCDRVPCGLRKCPAPLSRRNAQAAVQTPPKRAVVPSLGSGIASAPRYTYLYPCVPAGSYRGNLGGPKP